MSKTLTSDLIKLLEKSLKENGDLPIRFSPIYEELLKKFPEIREKIISNYSFNNPKITLDYTYDYGHKSEPYRGAPEELIIIIESK